MHYSHEGSCHCGAIGITLRTTRPPHDQVLGACQCGFCRKHNARAFSDPDASVTLVAHEPEHLQRYSFGLRTAEAVICRRCGVYVAMVSLKGIAPGARSTSTPSRSAPHLLDQPNPGISAPRMSAAGLRAARPAGARRPWWLGPDDQTRDLERMANGWNPLPSSDLVLSWPPAGRRPTAHESSSRRPNSRVRISLGICLIAIPVFGLSLTVSGPVAEPSRNNGRVRNRGRATASPNAPEFQAFWRFLDIILADCRNLCHHGF